MIMQVQGDREGSGRGESYGASRLLLVLEQFGIYPTQIVSRGEVSKIHTGKQIYALKRGEWDPLKLIFFLEAMDYLWGRGFYRMARLVKTTGGEFFVRHGTEVFFLTEWIEGRYIDFSRDEELRLAVRALAEMHLKGEGFSPLRPCVLRDDVGRWPDKWKKRIIDLEEMARMSRGSEDAFDVIFQRQISRALADAKEALQALELSGYEDYCSRLKQTRPLCHRDFVHHNLIYTGTDAVLIDFEYCVRDSRVIDLARMIRTIGKRHPWEADTAARILSLYGRDYPLSETEHRLLLALLIFPHEIWRAGHRWYFSGQKKQSIFDLLDRQDQYREQKDEVLRELAREFTFPPRS